jgi:GntR family transcriptional repressor for pyruvate dehydrogenase complex
MLLTWRQGRLRRIKEVERMGHEVVARHRSAADDVAHAVVRAIKAGEYRPGDRLPTEPELARTLGVGRTSVREGIGQLRMLGIVEVRRGLGTFVVAEEGDAKLAFLHWTAAHHDQIIALFEVRMSLEATAAALAAQRADGGQLAALQEAAAEHHRAHLASDLGLLVTTDQAFHERLLLASDNEVLWNVYGMLVPQLVDYRRKSLALHGAPERSSDDHLAIVEAVRRRDPRHAREAALSHLSSLYRELLAAGGAEGMNGLGEVPLL